MVSMNARYFEASYDVNKHGVWVKSYIRGINMCYLIVCKLKSAYTMEYILKRKENTDFGTNKLKTLSDSKHFSYQLYIRCLHAFRIVFSL